MAGRVPPGDRATARAVLVANLREASSKAADAGLTLLLEPLNPDDAPGYLYSTLDEAAVVLEEVDRPNVKSMFDSYHVGKVGEDVVGALDRHYLSVGHVQFAAVPTRAQPEAGDEDLRALVDALGRHGYQGWIGAEYKPRGNTDDSLGWMAGLTGRT